MGAVEWHQQIVILENIFSFLDGKTLLRARQVCRVWRDILENLCNHRTTWKQQSELEIPDDVLEEITINLYPGWPNSELKVNWYLVYKTWKLWLSHRKWPLTARIIFTCDSKPDHVMCIKGSGSCIITGHRNGSIKFWSRYSGFLRDGPCHLREVTDLGLLALHKEKVSSVDVALDVKHDCLISTSKDWSIMVYNFHSGDVCWKNRQHLKGIISVRVYRDIFAVLSLDSSVTIWKIAAKSLKDCTVSKIRHYTFSAEPLGAVSIWKYMFSGISVFASRFWKQSSDLKDLAASVTCINSGGVDFPVHSVPADSIVCRITETQAWRNKVFTWLSAEHQMYVAIEKNISSYCTMKDLKSYPLTLLLYGNMFFLGLESGEVILYKIADPEDLLNLDLRKIHRRFAIQKEPVTALEVVETEWGPTFLIGTLKTLYCISMFYQSE